MSRSSRQHPDQSLENALHRIVKQRAEAEISKRNVAFVLEHQHDTLAQLSAYLKSCYTDLGHPPTRTEVIGGDYLDCRFGSWMKALQSIGVRNHWALHAAPKKIENTKIYQDEYAAQKLLHQQEKQQKKEANKKKDAERRRLAQSAAKAGGAK